ncbi:hypothetical protein GCM10027586_07480 [Kineococcus gypseus]|uniref:hypothetical protein n=1 Tax=Kineococcus gypseus TaxID=1637102 RepID=UPI003D7CB443
MGDAAVTRRSGSACTCGHAKDVHEHYRAGSDCALCECPRYSPTTGLRALLRVFTHR